MYLYFSPSKHHEEYGLKDEDEYVTRHFNPYVVFSPSTNLKALCKIRTLQIHTSEHCSHLYLHNKNLVLRSKNEVSYFQIDITRTKHWTNQINLRYTLLSNWQRRDYNKLWNSNYNIRRVLGMTIRRVQFEMGQPSLPPINRVISCPYSPCYPFKAQKVGSRPLPRLVLVHFFIIFCFW